MALGSSLTIINLFHSFHIYNHISITPPRIRAAVWSDRLSAVSQCQEKYSEHLEHDDSKGLIYVFYLVGLRFNL
jgi:hypothetical protein